LSRRPDDEVAAHLSLRPPDPERRELKGRIASGVGWKGASAVISQLTRLGVVVVLTRLLSPRDFGVAGMVLVVLPFMVNFADFGLGIALVQRPKITELEISSVFWASLGIGAVLSVLGAAVSPLVALFYGRGEVAALFAVLTLGFFITSLGSTHRSLLVRSMNFRVLELRLIAGSLVGAVVGIGLAVAGTGPWALVGMQLATAVTSTALLWTMSGWRPAATFSAASVRELGAFGGRYLGATTFLTMNRNVDNVLVGRYLGAIPLGFYTLAYSVILSPLSRLSGPVMQILTPALSRLQDDKEALAAGWLRSTRLLAVAVLPLTLTIAFTAHDLVDLVFGKRWDGAIRVMQILACVSAVQCLQLHDVVMQALGRMSTFFWISAASFGMNLVGFVVGLHWGIVGVATGFAICSGIYFAGYTVLVSRILGIGSLRLVGALSGVLQAAAALVAAEILVQQLIEGDSTDLARMCAVTAGGVAAFAVGCAWRAPDVFTELRRLFGQVTGRRRAPTVPAAA
jgi:O-antigen/teichoic acid export membrane protein